METSGARLNISIGGEGVGEGQNLPPISQSSVEQTSDAIVKLQQTKNAWKPERKLDIPDLNYAVTKQLYHVRGILNKITPSNFAELSCEFLKLEVHKNKEIMGTIIDIIFNKAINEPKYCPLYSDLCKEQVKLEMKTTGSKSDFRSGILTKCQQMFEMKREETLQQLRKEAEAETDGKKKAQLLAECDEAVCEERRRMFGNIAFISELYRNELLVPLILQWCIVHLFQLHANTSGGDEESVEYAVKILEMVGKKFDRDSAEAKERAQKTLFLLQYYKKISEQGCNDGRVEHAVKMLEEVCKKFGQVGWPVTATEMAQKTQLYYCHLQVISNMKQVSNRVRFSIDNLIALRNNDWEPRKSTCQDPQELKEVCVDSKEELTNKILRDQVVRLSSTNHSSHLQSAAAASNSMLVTDNSLKLSMATRGPLGTLGSAGPNKWTDDEKRCSLSDDSE